MCVVTHFSTKPHSDTYLKQTENGHEVPSESNRVIRFFFILFFLFFFLEREAYSESSLKTDMISMVENEYRWFDEEEKYANSFRCRDDVKIEDMYLDVLDKYIPISLLNL